MLCEIIVIISFLVMLFLTVVLVIVIVDKKHLDIKIVPQNNKQKDECKEFSGEELREFFVSEYIDSTKCMYVKLQSLPESFKIGSVYFNKTETDIGMFMPIGTKEFSILSYVEINGKVFDNGFTQYYASTNCHVGGIENMDLLEYILNNLDKVEEVEQ